MFTLNIVIFHSYVKLPEGIWNWMVYTGTSYSNEWYGWWWTCATLILDHLGHLHMEEILHPLKFVVFPLFKGYQSLKVVQHFFHPPHDTNETHVISDCIFIWWVLRLFCVGSLSSTMLPGLARPVQNKYLAIMGRYPPNSDQMIYY